MSHKLTQTQFIEKAHAQHGKKYDYSQAKFINTRSKVILGCPTHGAFVQAAGTHINGGGCPKCGHRKAGAGRKTHEEFLRKARAVHGERYNYYKTVYESSRSKLIITCPIHGDFEQNANGHLRGNSCPACGKQQKSDSLATFIEKARAVNGDRYDYSKTVYKNTRSNIEVRCPEHGFFIVNASHHLRGLRCRKCGSLPRKQPKRPSVAGVTQENFIERARAVHGDRYDYSKTVYELLQGKASKVIITCLTHGDFEQHARTHLTGSGCARCGNARSSAKRAHSQEDFIEKARAVHGDRYDYSRVLYSTATSNVTIVCLDHGAFEQAPFSHTAGAGCRKCGIAMQGIATRNTLGDFVESARAVHGDRYDYSKTVYELSVKKVIITCPDHGDFKQVPTSHLAGAGCPVCGKQKSADSKRGNLEEFIAKARELHNDRYTYPDAQYTTARSKISITCPDHGVFYQTPDDHLQGGRCPACAIIAKKIAWVEKASGRIGILYFLKVFNANELFYKVGITFNSVAVRYANTSSLNGYQYEVLASYSNPNAAVVFEWEQSILETFSDLQYFPKRSFGGETECFTQAEPILEALPFGTVFYE
jgi:hypothetical protein